MAVYQDTEKGRVLLKRSSTKTEIVQEIKDVKASLGLKVSPCMKDNLKPIVATTSTGDN